MTEVRERQLARQACANAALSPQQVVEQCHINAPLQAKILAAIEKLHVSARAYHRILKVSRTIADLDTANGVDFDHVLEALSFRLFDKAST